MQYYFENLIIAKRKWEPARGFLNCSAKPNSWVENITVGRLAQCGLLTTKYQ